VYAYPNPYKGSHAQEQSGVVRPSGTRFYDRQLYFANVPSGAVIRIFSLAGDYLGKVANDNSDDSRVEWDMMTRHGQEIVSGIYYYTVEYKGDFKIDKFVVIK
jgi:hypothetical protein